MDGQVMAAAAYTLARKHALRVDYVLQWLGRNNIESTEIQALYEMGSLEFLERLYA